MFTPETSFCRNKWCQNKGSIPASGNELNVAKCGSFYTMQNDLKKGGHTGRGVTPCNLGFIQENANNRAFLSPFKLNDVNILFEPNRPTFLPPQGNVRSLKRIGYEWRS